MVIHECNIFWSFPISPAILLCPPLNPVIPSFSQLYLTCFCLFSWCFNWFICFRQPKIHLEIRLSLYELLVRSNLGSHRDILISSEVSHPNKSKICTRSHLLKGLNTYQHYYTGTKPLTYEHLGKKNKNGKIYSLTPSC